MAIAVSNDNGDGGITKDMKTKLSKKINNYEYLRPRPTLRSKAVWTPTNRQTESNDWYLTQQLVHNFNSDVVRTKEISKDSAAQQYLSKIMQKNDDIHMITYANDCNFV